MKNKEILIKNSDWWEDEKSKNHCNEKSKI